MYSFIYHHYVENIQFCTVLLEMIISARILSEFSKTDQFPYISPLCRKSTVLHRFARNDYFCKNSPKILKTDQFPYISPLRRKYTVLHRFARNDYFCQNSTRILKTDQFPYISPLCRKSTVLHFSVLKCLTFLRFSRSYEFRRTS